MSEDLTTMPLGDLRAKLAQVKRRMYIAGCADDGCGPDWWATHRERVQIETELKRRGEPASGKKGKVK